MSIGVLYINTYIYIFTDGEHCRHIIYGIFIWTALVTVGRQAQYIFVSRR